MTTTATAPQLTDDMGEITARRQRTGAGSDLVPSVGRASA